MTKTWLITGASRGLGLEIARAALAAGDSVVATARSPQRLADALGLDGERLHGVGLDVTDPKGAARVAQAAIDRFGRIDVLVNNAGHAQLGWFETISDAQVRQQFEVNVFGAISVARAVLPHMRARRSGLIVAISSVSGLAASPGGSIYSASKFALEGWMEGLAQEVEPLGIRSLLVEPGMLRTDFLDDRSARHGDVEAPAQADYADAAAQFRWFIAEANGKQPGDPARLAGRIVELTAEPSPPARVLFGDDAIQGAAGKVDRLRADIERSDDQPRRLIA